MRGTINLALFTAAILLPLSAVNAAPLSKQEIYNQAQIDFDKGEWAKAVAGFELVAKPDDGVAPVHSQAIIRSRMAQAYAALGYTDKTFNSAHIALRGLGDNEVVERAAVWMAIGDADRLNLSFNQAVEDYKRAHDAAILANDLAVKQNADLDTAIALLTVDPAQSAKILDDMIGNSPAKEKEAGPRSKIYNAELQDLRGRAAMNLGDANLAYRYFESAIYMSGGTDGSTINHIQQSIRGDAAIAAQLKHDDENTRELLTSSGAGHLPSNDWMRGLGDPPVCGGIADIKPQDTVVVEFSINADGSVIGAAPIYVSRTGPQGAEFARAVLNWHWNPDMVAKLEPFWRYSVRVQLRCITRPHPNELSTEFVRETAEWLQTKGVASQDILPLAKSIVPQEDPRLTRDDVSSIAALISRITIEADRKHQDTNALLLDRALNNADAPPSVRALVIAKRSTHGGANAPEYFAHQLSLFKLRYPVSKEAVWLSLEYAIVLENAGRFHQAMPILEQVAVAPVTIIDVDSAIRKVAILHLAALQKKAGDAAGAQARITAAGLSRAQCSVVDVRPVATNTSIASSDFPTEAIRWNFEGYVREAFDIGSNGHVENTRTVLAYPPFVFGPATEHTVARFRYIPPVLDGTAVGCDGHTQSVRYLIPGH